MGKVNLEEFELGQETLNKVLGGNSVSTPGILQTGYDAEFWCDSDTGDPSTGSITGHDCCRLRKDGTCY